MGWGSKPLHDAAGLCHLSYRHACRGEHGIQLIESFDVQTSPTPEKQVKEVIWTRKYTKEKTLFNSPGINLIVCFFCKGESREE